MWCCYCQWDCAQGRIYSFYCFLCINLITFTGSVSFPLPLPGELHPGVTCQHIEGGLLRPETTQTEPSHKLQFPEGQKVGPVELAAKPNGLCEQRQRNRQERNIKNRRMARSLDENAEEIRDKRLIRMEKSASQGRPFLDWRSLIISEH